MGLITDPSFLKIRKLIQKNVIILLEEEIGYVWIYKNLIRAHLYYTKQK